MWLSVCFPGSPGSTAARLGPASVRMACSVVPPSHLIACILPTEPPIQPGLQDRITKKKILRLGRRIGASAGPCSAESARSRREGRG